MSNFSPVKVSDPTSKFHTVSLHRGQDLVLTSHYRKIENVYHGQFLRIKERIPIDTGESLTFEHTAFDEGWDATSSVYLGEIIATIEDTGESGKFLSREMRICVFLESSNS